MPRELTAEQNLTVQGVTIPKLGLGTSALRGDDCAEAVRDALELGYRHIDTAPSYGNEDAVGRGLAASGVARGDVFLTTKLSHDGLDADGVPRQLADSLEHLGTDYVDLLLIHWPHPEVPLAETLDAMKSLCSAGQTRAIGVSNFPSGLLAQALKLAPILANQVEYHAYLAQPELLALARDHDLALTAYRPLAGSRLLDDEVMRDVAAAHGKTAGQVALRWLLDQPKVAAIPKASSRENRAANLDIFDFDLDDDERARIAELALRHERTIDPSFAPEWD
ncbi:MAG: aldo/keto reductase [Thermoleophilaceae bacterium]